VNEVADLEGKSQKQELCLKKASGKDVFSRSVQIQAHEHQSLDSRGQRE
jgi:hypothetical protein